MTLEKLLQQRFGLIGSFRVSEDIIQKYLQEYNKTEVRGEAPDWNPEKLYTKAGWDAWQRLLDTLDEMVEVGILTEDESLNISARICDIA